MVCCCCAWCHLFRPNDTGIKRVQRSNLEGLLDDLRCNVLFEGSLNRLQECPLVHGAIGVPCPIIKDLGIPPLELREPQYIQGCTMNESVLGCNKESQYILCKAWVVCGGRHRTAMPWLSAYSRSPQVKWEAWPSTTRSLLRPFAICTVCASKTVSIHCDPMIFDEYPFSDMRILSSVSSIQRFMIALTGTPRDCSAPLTRLS